MALSARVVRNFLCVFHNNNYQLIKNSSKNVHCEGKLFKILAANKQIGNIRFLCHEFGDNQNKYALFLNQRREEAKKSVLIEVQSNKLMTDLHSYCKKFGKIKCMFHYVTQGPERHFVLIEYENKENFDALLSESNYLHVDQIIPARSTMLWFRSQKPKKTTSDNTDDWNLLQKNCCRKLSLREVIKTLRTATTISEQMMLLYEAVKMSDPEVRLKFLTAYQIENCFLNLFPNMAVLPFGSSINGFGKQGCDLDLSMVLEKTKTNKDDFKLVFQSKSFFLHEKQQMKKIMETVADTINIFVPGISNVKKILEARVPIVRFDQVLTGIECDLTILNMSGFHMSELLHFFGEIDERVRPLVFNVKQWAHSWKLTTKSIPGPWISNFSLTLMVIFYLQQKKILPSLILNKSEHGGHIRTDNVFIHHLFLQDIMKKFKKNFISNTDSLESLLLDFFIYYGNFDFETKAISVREGKFISKPEYSALYICNPLETNMNVSKNVNFEELEKIRSAMRSASWYLEASQQSQSKDWGILNFLTDNNIHKIKTNNSKSKDKLINFRSLFKDDNSIRTND